MKANESRAPVATIQFRIIYAILQLPCILKACTLAHFRSLGINPVVESRVSNPNTAPIIFSVIYRTEKYFKGLVMFYLHLTRGFLYKQQMKKFINGKEILEKKLLKQIDKLICH
jgi:hypothetical protein